MWKIVNIDRRLIIYHEWEYLLDVQCDWYVATTATASIASTASTASAMPVVKRWNKANVGVDFLPGRWQTQAHTHTDTRKNHQPPPHPNNLFILPVLLFPLSHFYCCCICFTRFCRCPVTNLYENVLVPFSASYHHNSQFSPRGFFGFMSPLLKIKFVQWFWYDINRFFSTHISGKILSEPRTARQAIQ